MNRHDDQFRHIVHEAGERYPAGPPPLSDLLRSGHRARKRRRAIQVGGSVAAVALIAAAGFALRPGTGSGAEPTTNPSPPATVVTQGLVAASPDLSTSLDLQQTEVAAGTEITGDIVVTNSSNQPIDLTGRCRPKYAVVLTNDDLPPVAGFDDECTMSPMLMDPGETRLPVTVLTRYGACTGDGPARPVIPLCLNSGETPTLPVGSYDAVLIGSGDLPLPPPTPVPVVLTAP